HARQLAFKPNLQFTRRSRRPLLRGLEQARRSALAHHVPRIEPMGARVLINGTRYYIRSATRRDRTPGYRIGQDQAGDIWQGIAARWGRDQSFAPWHRSSNRRSATPRDHFHQRAAGSCSASGFLDLNLLLLLRHLRWLWQVDVQFALIKFCPDLRRIRIEWQRDRPAKRAIAAFHHVPVLVLVLLIARGLFLTADGQHPISECYVEIFLINAWQLG